MPRISSRRPVGLAVLLILLAGCGAKGQRTDRVETFTWVRQPIVFAPPSGPWQRQGEGGSGTLGVYFILRGGGGQCISVAAYNRLADRDRREALAKLVSRRDSLSQREFLNELSLARPRTEDPISDREASATQAINRALDRAMTAYLDGSRSFVTADLEDALDRGERVPADAQELLPHDPPPARAHAGAGSLAHRLRARHDDRGVSGVRERRHADHAPNVPALSPGLLGRRTVARSTRPIRECPRT